MSFRAYAQLGLYFFKVLIARMFGVRPGLSMFQQNYVQSEGLNPVTQKQRALLLMASKCTSCRECDRAFSAYHEVNPRVFRKPSDLPLFVSRHLPSLPLAKDYIHELKKGDLTQLEAICPVQVPFKGLVDWIERS